jgi:hypothetical protein
LTDITGMCFCHIDSRSLKFEKNLIMFIKV